MTKLVEAKTLNIGDYYKVARDANLYRVTSKSPRGDIGGKHVCQHKRKDRRGYWVTSWTKITPISGADVEKHRGHVQWIELNRNSER